MSSPETNATDAVLSIRFAEQLEDAFAEDRQPEEIETDLGRLKVYYGTDPDVGEDFAWIYAALPDGFYAEIEDDTYGRLTGLRFCLLVERS